MAPTYPLSSEGIGRHGGPEGKMQGRAHATFHGPHGGSGPIGLRFGANGPKGNWVPLGDFRFNVTYGSWHLVVKWRQCLFRVLTVFKR